MLVVQLQNELAKLEVDILHTQGHNARLAQAMQLLDEDINEKMLTIGKYEVCLTDYCSRAVVLGCFKLQRFLLCRLVAYTCLPLLLFLCICLECLTCLGMFISYVLMNVV